MKKTVLTLLLILFSLPAPATCSGKIIYGIVIDDSTETPLPNTNVWLLGVNRGTVCDANGAFRLSGMSDAEDTLSVRYIGYQVMKVPVVFAGHDSLFFTIRLHSQALVFPEISITKFRDAVDKRLLALETTPIRIRQLDLVAGVISVVPDVYQSLQTYAGITTAGEISNQIYVRGGLPDQNLVLLDGAVIYYPFHIYGLAAAFNPDMIEQLTVSTGGFSAQYGSRLSSVFNITTRQPDNKISISSNLNILGADANVCGKIGRRFLYLLSGRRSYFDLFSRNLPYFYDDLYAKIQYLVNEANLFTVSSFIFNDMFEEVDKLPNKLLSHFQPGQTMSYKSVMTKQYGWGNRVCNLNWNHRWSETVHAELQAYYSRSHNQYNIDYSFEFPDHLSHEFNEMKHDIIQRDKRKPEHVNNVISDATVKHRWVWEPTTTMQWSGGVEYSAFHTDYGWDNSSSDLVRTYYNHVGLYFDFAPIGEFAYNRKFQSTAAYGEGVIDITTLFRLRAGLRMTRWNFHHHIEWEPRLNMSYKLSDRTDCKIAYGRFTQGLATALEDGAIGFLELYFPVDVGKHVERADHYIISMEHVSRHGNKYSISAYFKVYDGLLRSIGPGPDFIQTTGESWGLELALQAKWFGWAWQSNAVLARARRTSPGFTYDLVADQRFRFQVSAMRTFSKHWQIGGYWIFHTGRPYASFEVIGFERTANWEHGITAFHDDWFRLVRDIDVPRDAIRYPYYHRLDLSLRYKTHYKTVAVEPYLSIRNVYYRKNVLYYKNNHELYWQDYAMLYKDSRLTREHKFLPIIPSIGVRCVF